MRKAKGKAARTRCKGCGPYRLRRLARPSAATLATLRELYASTISGEWVGDDHTFWVARGRRGNIVGFCSAVFRPETRCVLLSSAVVVQAARGAGLQQRMIRARVAWARRQGAAEAITYTGLRNYGSMVNLVRSGFRFYTSEVNDPDKKHFHFLRRSLCKS